MEAQKEKTVWNLWFGICSRREEFVPGRKRVLETEKEKVLVSEDVEKVCSSFISRDENPVPKRVASPI